MQWLEKQDSQASHQFPSLLKQATVSRKSIDDTDKARHQVLFSIFDRAVEEIAEENFAANERGRGGGMERGGGEGKGR